MHSLRVSHEACESVLKCQNTQTKCIQLNRAHRIFPSMLHNNNKKTKQTSRNIHKALKIHQSLLPHRQKMRRSNYSFKKKFRLTKVHLINRHIFFFLCFGSVAWIFLSHIFVSISVSCAAIGRLVRTHFVFDIGLLLLLSSSSSVCAMRAQYVSGHRTNVASMH